MLFYPKQASGGGASGDALLLSGSGNGFFKLMSGDFFLLSG